MYKRQVITVKLLSDATGSVTVNVNGKDYTGTVVNGIANVKVSGLCLLYTSRCV